MNRETREQNQQEFVEDIQQMSCEALQNNLKVIKSYVVLYQTTLDRARDQLLGRLTENSNTPDPVSDYFNIVSDAYEKELAELEESLKFAEFMQKALEKELRLRGKE